MNTKKSLDLSKKIQEQSMITVLLGLLFLIQFLIVVYFNFTSTPSHLTYDTSWTYLKAILMNKEKAIVSSSWYEQSNIFLDSSVVLAAPLYGLVKNIYVAYAIANLLILVPLLLTFNSILKLIKVGATGRLFALNMLICPYLCNGFNLANDLGYMQNVLTGPAFYSVRILIVLLVVRAMISVYQTGKLDVAAWISLALCAIIGASSGIYILVVLFAPYFIYKLIELYCKNDVRVLKKPDCMYAYLATAMVLLGKVTATRFFGIESFDVSKSWSSLTDLPHNMLAPVLGFLKLLEVLPIVDNEVAILSGAGILHIFPGLIICIILVSIIFAIKCAKANGFDLNNSMSNLAMTIIGTNFLVMGLFNATYGTLIFEERYLLTTFLFCVILVATYIDRADKKLLFSQSVKVALLASLCVTSFSSDIIYMTSTDNVQLMQEISDTATRENTELIYFWGDRLRPIGNKMRLVDMDHVYTSLRDIGQPDYWGDYRRYEDNSEYSGATLLIIPSSNDVVPEYILEQYELISELDGMKILKCPTNPLDRLSGINGTVNVDLPYSPGIQVQNGHFEKSSYVSDGTEGYVLRGPETSSKAGTYEFVLNYELLKGNDATFEIVLDYGEAPIASTTLTSDGEMAVVNNVAISEGQILEYRVHCGDGTVVVIHSITITAL